VQGQAELAQVVGGLDAAGCRAHLRHGRQQQPEQHRDDRQHHE
jgi:hypothetical protein